jgi:hypothetical protein
MLGAMLVCLCSVIGGLAYAAVNAPSRKLPRAVFTPADAIEPRNVARFLK